MDQQKLLAIILLLGTALSLWVFFNNEMWNEPDSTAFYNRSCLGGSDFETPILSRAVFDLLPCDPILWKIFHVLLILATISALYYFTKKMKMESEWFAFSFLSYFLLSFILQIEDDQLAFPLIIVASARLLSNITWSKRIGYGIILTLIYLLIWKGALIPMGIILAYSINPILAILFPITLFIEQFFRTGIFGWGDGVTNETTVGIHFFQNDIPLLLLLLAKDKKKKILENKDLFGLFTAFNVLAFIYPKLAYYSVIPLLMIGYKFFDENQRYLLGLGGIISLALAPALILYNSYPTQHAWDVIEEAVVIQKQGQPVYNQWDLGRWFYYKGGIPSEEGGKKTDQLIDLNDYYWLGIHRIGCTTISSSGVVYLDHCVNINNYWITDTN